MSAVCVCCTSRNGYFVNIMTCSHAGFLENLMKKLDWDKWYVCGVCHNMLKKIEIFKRQVEESVELLTGKAQHLKISKLHNLNNSKMFTTEVTRDTPNEETKSETIRDKAETQPEMTWEVKIEQEVTFDYECDLPVADTKPSSGQEDERYKDKIAMIAMNEEQLNEDREKLRRSEGYLKLPYKCETCIVGFDHEDTLKRHMDTRHKEKNNGFTCNVCSSVLASKSSHNLHMGNHYNRYVCLKCGKIFSKLKSAEQHYDVTHASPGATIHQLYTCRNCDFDTNSYVEYRSHKELHKEKPTCGLCYKHFASNTTLKLHIDNVHKNVNANKYKCDQCGKAYKTKYGLIWHRDKVHSSGEMAYCKVCDTQYQNKHILKQHINTHSNHVKDEDKKDKVNSSGEMAYCKVCDTQFQNKYVLKQHINTHSNHVKDEDKKFICDICGSKFPMKGLLAFHIKCKHIRMNAHRCETCGKGFSYEHHLRRHVKYVHDKIRPPRDKICQYCGKGFTTKTILERHVRIHTGEKPLHCDQCPSKFANGGALYIHKKQVHKRRAELPS